MSAVFVGPKSLFSDSHPALSVISHPDPETDLNPACFQNFISHAKIMIHVAPRLNFTAYRTIYKIYIKNQCCGSGSVWIRIIFCTEHNKIIWRENLPTYACWLGPGRPTDKEIQIKINEVAAFGSVSKWKVGTASTATGNSWLNRPIWD